MGKKRSFDFAFKSSIYSDRLLHVRAEGERPDKVDEEKPLSEDRQPAEPEEEGTKSGEERRNECEADIEAFQQLIRFFYTEELPGNDSATLIRLLKVADRFESALCMESCVSALLQAPRSLETALLYLSLPEAVKSSPAAKPLVSSVSDFVGWSFDQVLSADNIAEMPFSMIKHLLESAPLGSGCEEILFKCFLEWARSGGDVSSGSNVSKDGREAKVKELAGFLKYPFMDPRFLETEVASAPEMQTPVCQLHLQEARTFWQGSEQEREQMRAQNPTCRLRPREGCPESARVSKSEKGEWVVDVRFPVEEVTGFKVEQVVEKNVKIRPDLSCCVQLIRKAPDEKKRADDGRVGVFVGLVGPARRDGAAVSARWRVGFRNQETGRYERKLDGGSCSDTFTRVFADDILCLGVKDIGIEWRNFCLREGPFLVDGNLYVRAAFEKLVIDRAG
ncbi:BTB/POZ/Kelch-associated protein [Klebsormidium nitens]|uniref:BTB/POZ/Kelch-associated protein n=1 Tax=Klebsormidium nitens TaxID=105231 RepID=A0A1Y1I186_KLENI|nr:BTB/POZ/Kelch-associated protein [Klebsormidium nitens]|eukprot:GAQ82941.1 BTB/POZ/Kelch-associated protein [Klebsormidium nitens]